MHFHTLALLFMFSASPALAAECKGVDLTADPSIKPNSSAYADDLVNGEGLLWRIEKSGLQPSFIFGTARLTDPRAIAVAAQTEPYVKTAAIVATEFGDPDNIKAANAAFVRDAREPDRDVFGGLIEGDDAGRVEALFTRRGFAVETTHHLKLWFLWNYAVWPSCELEKIHDGAPTVIRYIVNRAKANGKDVIGLLPPAKYVRAVESIPDADAATQLKLMARSDAFLDNTFATSLSLYEQKRPGAVRAFTEFQPGITEAEHQANDNIYKLIGFDFNDPLVRGAAPLLEIGGAFMAVGAGNLWGRRGLVERIRAMGYVVTKVW